VKVLLITGEYPPMRGGVADYSCLLSDGLQRLGVDVTVLTSARAVSGAHENGNSIAATVQDWGAGLWADVAEQVARVRPDVIHVQYQTGAFGMRLGINLLPWRKKLRGGLPPIVVTFHDLKEPYLLPKIGRARHLATVLLAAASDAVVLTNPEDFGRVVGRPTNDRSRLSWGGTRAVATPIGSNIPPLRTDFKRDRFRERIGVRADEVVLAFFGFLVPSKGLDTLVDAFDVLVDRGRAIRLLMVGAGGGDTGTPDRAYETSIRQRLNAPRVRGRVIWTGFLHPADVAAYLSAADICCLPFRDGVSIRHGTLVAAVVLGLPIITTNGLGAVPHPRYPKLISDHNVILVPPGGTSQLTDAIERLLADRDLRTKLSSGARALGGAFGWDLISDDTLRLYRELPSAVL
jgi:glycosyltransferase involved in cell wall biosynthesis